ncbi:MULTISPECIES: CinA family protein [Sphingobacterium]|uniref:CinA family protein n=1 Tax=Sphingobacterium TaxID=28453 RepID=UPI0013DAE61C|nr:MULTISPECIES: CinA family protein [unclassified Sphingobacterium]
MSWELCKCKYLWICAESAVATLRILDGLRARFPQAQVYVSVTGLAYETENPKQKRPIGTVYYAFRLEDSTVIYKRKFKGNAAEIIVKTCNGILSDLSKWLAAKAKEKKTVV